MTSQLNCDEGVQPFGTPLRALRVRVRPDRVEALVAVAAERYAQTDENGILPLLPVLNFNF